MGMRCSQCGMIMPTFGNVCPFCHTRRDDGSLPLGCWVVVVIGFLAVFTFLIPVIPALFMIFFGEKKP